MDAILLVDWHLVLFEVEVCDALLEDTNEEIVGEFILIGETSTRDSLKAGEKCLISLVALGDRVERLLRELVIVAVVAERRGPLGKIAEIGLILLFEERVLSSETVSNWFEVLGEDGTGYGEDEK